MEHIHEFYRAFDGDLREDCASATRIQIVGGDFVEAAAGVT